MTGKLHLCDNSRDDTPEGHGRPKRGEGDERFRKSPAKKPFGTTCHRLLEGKTRRLVQGQPGVGVCVRGTAFSGDGGVPGVEVPLLRYDGRKHASCTIMSSIGCAGQTPPAPGPRALRTFKRMSIGHQVESGAPINADGDVRMDMVIERGGLRDATASEYRSKSILVDVTFADPQAVGQMRAGSADRDGLAVSKSEARKCSHYARPGQVSFDERGYKLATLAVESFGRLRKDGSDLVDQVAASIFGGTDGTSLARKGACKERLSQKMSVTTQVAITRRVHRHKLALRDRQAAKGSREQTGRVPMPMAWGWNVDGE